MAAVTGPLALLLTVAATLGFVLKILIVEKTLFTGGEDEIGAAIGALKGSVLKF